MIFYPTKQTIERLNITLDMDLPLERREIARKIIQLEKDRELNEWGLKLFYFDGRKCLQIINFASKLTIFIFDVKVRTMKDIPDILAHYLLELYTGDKEMETCLLKYFKEYPLVAFSKLINRSMISQLNHNQSYYANDGEVFYEYIIDEVLLTKNINKDYNFRYLVTQTNNGKKDYIYPGERFRELILQFYK